MTKLMIVDDDEFIRKGLQYLIDWVDLGIEVVGEAESGSEALDIFIRKQPHIVITDISMPHGDGLFLIESIRSMRQDTRIIVLSGYNDYEYVRRAMKFQIDDYLLKPVDADELKQIILLCTEKIERNWFNEQMKRESFHLLRNNILNRWVHHQIHLEALKDKLEFLGLKIRNHRLYQVSLIDWRNFREGRLTEAEENFRSFAIHNSMNELMTIQGRGLTFLNENKQIVSVFMGETDDAQHFELMNKSWMEEKAEQVAPLLKTPWYCTFGKSCASVENVHHSYNDAVALLDYMQYTGSISVIDSVSSDRPVQTILPSAAERDLVLQSLATLNHNVWARFLEEDFHWAVHQPEPLVALKHIATEWIVLVKQTFKKRNLDIHATDFEELLYSDVYLKHSGAEMRQNLYHILSSLEKYIHHAAEQKKNPIIEGVESYVGEHYHEELTLQILATKFHVNNIYLGRLFKEETGVLFSDYLNAMRIDQAKKLLQQTNLKASEIAVQVGFQDPNYFFRKFKQETGLSPTDYRKLQS